MEGAMNDHPGDRGARAVRGWRRASLLALLSIACAERDVPSTLVGHWKSNAPRYAGRSLVIGPATIAFGTGPISSESFVIEGVESEKAPDGAVLHAVHYRDTDGSTRTIRVQVLPGSAPTLRFENHAELWARESGGPKPPRGG
jgi:hypothetical protein